MATKLAVYNSKSYDREYFERSNSSGELKLKFYEFQLDADNVGTAAGQDAVCIFVNDRVNRACLEKLKAEGIKLIALRCAGFNNVDLEAARDLALTVVRVPAYSPHAVAEHTLALLLCLNRKIHRAYNRVRELNFSLGGLVGFDLYGKSIGILGTGKIGRITAGIFCGFGCKVTAYDPSPDCDWADSQGVEYKELGELLNMSDVVSLHMPLTQETQHILNDRAIDQMKDGAYLINTSRGKLVDSAAVVRALKSRKLGGLAIDVYEEEEGVFFEDLSGAPLQDDVLSRLLTFPNVLITAHQAFLTTEALTEIAETTCDSVRRFARGEQIPEDRFVVNPSSPDSEEQS